MSGYGLQSIPRSRILSYREVSYQRLIKMEDDGEQRFKEAKKTVIRETGDS